MTAKYARIGAALATDISRGRYQPGERLPSESEIMVTWGVSRTTARGAIRELVNNRLAYTVQGIGTFAVEGPLMNVLPSATSFSQVVHEQWRKPGSRIITFEHVEADPETAHRLEMAPTGPLLHLERVLLADEVPVSLSDTFLSVAALGDVHERLTTDAISRDGLYRTLESHGASIDGGDQTISSIAADMRVATMLEVTNRTPLLLAVRVGRTRGIPVEYSKIFTRPDQAVWAINLGNALAVEEPPQPPGSPPRGSSPTTNDRTKDSE